MPGSIRKIASAHGGIPNVKPYQPPPRFLKGPRPQDEDRAARDHWELAIAGDLTDKQDSLLDRLVDVPRGSNGTIYFESAGGSPYVGLGLATLIAEKYPGS